MSKPNTIFNSENKNGNGNQQTQLLPASSTSRSPLNAIPDPCQSAGAAPTPARLWGSHKGKSNSASSTPARCTITTITSNGANASRVSNVHHRPLHLRSGTVLRSVSNVKSEDSPHFELSEDPSFWNDHNVQVLIRIRPLSSMEKVSQGYGTCMKQESAQTLVWLGHPETRFTFDHIACQTISQEKLFQVAGLPMVDNCMSGYNSCMFAYGQTGSGKTYTMMGEIGQKDGKLDEHCGITPRIFQYLFTRIREEEENRSGEGLKYSCKCSFLEIYNEQITDLLEPSSTTLQLREDLKKGVYVENLSEYDVRSANDVITLLQEGAANRKMAATRMNSESSRSHSVFTCIIESRWERDSMNHFRFARLNLVDLAGSERQKSSGAEGDRLKEAANINKSLSTLGLVIMSLVDLPHGKPRHVPYRDSRLTFLLQDSLGGNSKTTIIANVSPSICSANETLSTLKFAQRAKLIQNNAKVNEDASGDVTALQRQIQQLKGQLNFLKNQVPSASRYEHRRSFFLESCDSFEEPATCDDDMANSGRYDKVKRMKTTLIGALRREKLAEMELRRLKTELEQTNYLVHQREEDVRQTKMMLTSQQERLKELELHADGILSADKYLLEENNTLREQIHILQARENKNSDITKLELENARLLHQLHLVQDFYEQGERETLLAELSQLSNQFLELLESERDYCHPQNFPVKDKQNNVAEELEECRDMNSRLIREADELQRVLDRHKIYNQDDFDSIQALSIATDQRDELISHKLPEDHALLSRKDQILSSVSMLHYEEIKNQLVDARSLIETVESKQARLLEELEFMQEENHRLTTMLNTKEMGRQPGIKCRNYSEGSSVAESQHHGPETILNEDIHKAALQAKLDKLSKDLEEALSLNSQYLVDQASRLSQDHQIELVRDEVEMETAKTILYLQEELVALQSEFEEKYSTVTEENVGLRKVLAAKDDEIRALTSEWENAILELTNFLLDGSKSLRDASHQIDGIASSFPRVNVWIGEHVQRAAKICIEKEETILFLQHSLEDAQKTVLLIEQKLNSLKGATIALTKLQQPDEASKLVTTVFDGDPLKKNVKNAEAEKYADNACSTRHNTEGNIPFTEDGDCSAMGLSTCGPLDGLMDHEHSAINDGFDRPIMLETIEMSEYQDLITQKANANGNNTIKFDAGNKFIQASGFFTKIEEAHATMKEADHMLKALLEKNENEKYMSFMWKQAGEELQVEKASLVQEIEQLKSSVSTKEGENEILQDQTSQCLLQIANSIAMLDGALDYMKKDVEELCRVAYCDASTMVKETLNGICSSRVMLEELFTKAIENETTSCFLECHLKDLIQRFRSMTAKRATSPATPPFELLEMKNAEQNSMSCEDPDVVKFMNWAPEKVETATSRGSEGGELIQFHIHGDLENEKLDLRKELERKEVLLKGLLFDFRLLQESTSCRQDLKDEFEKLIETVNQVQYELQMKTSELDDLLLQHRSLEDRLSMTENAFMNAKSDLEHAIETSNALSEQNADMQMCLKDLFLTKSKAEEQLEEQKEVTKSLEEEILRLTTSTEKQLAASVKEDDLRKLTEERDKLLEQLKSLQARLDMAFTLADENEAIAVEARQESETSKIYAEQKEEEVKILERSVEELECTINVLEKKVYEMENEVQRQHIIRESLELEIQALRERLSAVENLTESFHSEDLSMNLSRDQILRSVEVNEAQRQIKSLEEEKAEFVKEIKKCKEYISELVLHAEAQASKYNEKYKHLEAMVNQVKTDSSNVTSGVSTLEKAEKTSTRTRGSSSPFRCISNLVQQMNSEKNQELSTAKVRIQELEALASSRHKEVCILSSRLAAAESMTHDVIRDLLGVKLDMTNYANLADQYQLQKLVEEAQQQKQECDTKEEENSNLRRQIVDLIEERERCILDVNRREAEVLAVQMTLEQLKERDQLLSAQNEMLKADKTNLLRKVAELDDIVKHLFGTQDIQSQNRQTINLPKENNSRDLSQRPSHSGRQQQQFLQVDELLARPRRLSSANHPRKQSCHENETKHR